MLYPLITLAAVFFILVTAILIYLWRTQTDASVAKAKANEAFKLATTAQDNLDITKDLLTTAQNQTTLAIEEEKSKTAKLEQKLQWVEIKLQNQPKTLPITINPIVVKHYHYYKTKPKTTTPTKTPDQQIIKKVKQQIKELSQ